MILQLAQENRYGRGHTFTTIQEMRRYVKSVLSHPTGPTALAASTLVLPATSAQFALSVLPMAPKTVIVHGDDAEAVGAVLRASGQFTVIAL